MDLSSAYSVLINIYANYSKKSGYFYNNIEDYIFSICEMLTRLISPTLEKIFIPFC